MTPYSVLTVAFYIGLNGLILIWLAVHVGRVRARVGVWMGDEGNPTLIRAIRGQANFVEYVPFAMILLLMMAILETPAFVLHLFGLTLTAGRVLHALHFTKDDAPRWQRQWGAIATLAVLLLGSLGLLFHAVAQMG